MFMKDEQIKKLNDLAKAVNATWFKLTVNDNNEAVITNPETNETINLLEGLTSLSLSGPDITDEKTAKLFAEANIFSMIYVLQQERKEQKIQTAYQILIDIRDNGEENSEDTIEDAIGFLGEVLDE